MFTLCENNNKLCKDFINNKEKSKDKVKNIKDKKEKKIKY